MAEVPRFCRRTGCPQPAPKVLRETEEHWVLFCSYCESIQVLSKPHGRAKARWQRKMELLGRADKNKVYFLP